jgi:hypothetical protein
MTAITTKPMTREEWLLAATNLLRADFATVDAEIPEKVRATCGWPSQGGRPGKKQRIGEVWPPSCSEDGTTEIFINPMMSEGLEALDVLVHELVHAAVGCKEGHKGPFRVTAKAIGLEGKMTATNAGEVLMVRLREIVADLGAYPHAKLTPKKKKPQGTRMLKLLCPACGYLARTSQKWIDLGTPTCACGKKMEAV